MANRRSLIQSSSFQLNPRETLFCKSLVVGDTVAAYTATLAILQAGGQVCWVQPGKLDVGEYLNHGERSLAQYTRFSWRLGRQVNPWETAGVLSQSQQRFWSQWRPQAALPAASAPVPEEDEETPQSRPKQTQLREAIAPYLSSQQLMLITQADPLRMLYSEERGQRRLYQVVFRDRRTQQSFQIQAKLTLDATRNGTLQQLLAATPAGWPITAITLTAAHIKPSPRQARGLFFDDAIALVMAEPLSGSGPLRPISIPLRALIPQQIEGFLCVSQPGCEPALRPLFQQPRAQWTLGETAGHVAAKVIDTDSRLLDLVVQPSWRWHLQHHLIQSGIPLFAFDDVPLDDPDFEAIQMGAIANVVRTAKVSDLSFRPEVPVTRSVVASALTRLPRQELASAALTRASFEDVSQNHWAFNAIQKAIAIGVMGAEVPGVFAPSKVLSKRQLWNIVRSLYPPNGSFPPFAEDDTPARRRHLSRSLYPILKARLEL